MLDLNLDIISNESSCDGHHNNKNKDMVIISREMEMFSAEETAAAASRTTQMEDSGTSNSSIIINTEEAENSFNSALIFDILKKDEINPLGDFTTRQFFPDKIGNIELDLQSGLSKTRPQWLKLSQMEPSSEAELRIVQQKQQQMKKSRRGPRSRSSQYRGVTFYRRTGRWESHIWDCGKQVYLGGFDTALAAARAYDRAAIKFRGVDADINFNLSDYDEDMKQMKNLSKEEFVLILRRRSTGFARGSSKYRGVTLHKCGRWEARMGQFHGKKAYDMAAIKCNGRDAVTNFEPSVYEGEVVFDPSSREMSDHNLDLSLRISAPPSNDTGSCCFRYKDCELPKKETTVVENARSLPKASKNLPTLSGIYPGFLASNQEMVEEKKVEADSLLKSSSWPWNVNGNNNKKKNFATISEITSVAASSGFDSSATITAFHINQQQQQQQSHPVNNLCLTTPNKNSFHYYS
ncbi:ethylene-responsive transcription factor RAP2-7 isoform X2 [Manihot esculenta]|uniref:AP2/ERF domain-containing protein n=2 Tax=Manihot esculenta TaxID=3983 RepID=A0A2C9V381_MANES|nr:ethylene-responsive transcription factor RAP2-7 isoform X2 [Manihot esculenta]KAG8645198.1 hypothetical protein MANES_10G041100v8 [Manihot esculenta]OAY38776.1 hypothetical protein MANES_10G041100v8 [Manihot esculenta]